MELWQIGDGGIYFLGYSIAVLAIIGSIKSQMEAIMLIAMVGLGVPLFDTILSSENICQLWRRVILAAEKIHLSAINLELHPEAFGNNPLPTFTWENGATGKTVKMEKKDRYLRVEVPIVSNGASYATLSLNKSLKQGNDDRLILRRIEHLRRTITGAMEKLAIRSLTCPEVLEDRRRPDNHNGKEWNGHERRSLSNLSE